MPLNDKALADIERRLNTYRSSVADIRADPTLSDYGKRERLEKLYTDTSKYVADIKSTSDNSAYQRRKDLERRLFGIAAFSNPTEAISYRDAVDRVAATSSAQDLGELMERASTIGDTTLLRAAVHAAMQRGLSALNDHYSNLIGEYCEQNPGDADGIREYQQLTSVGSKQAAFTENLATSVQVPEEVTRPAPADVPVPPSRPEYEMTPRTDLGPAWRE